MPTTEPPKALQDLAGEVRRLSGCLLVIAGAEGCGNGSLRTAAYEAATMGATVADLASKLGSPVADMWVRPEVFVHLSAPPCDHSFGGYREHEDGRGGEQFCSKCGMGAMAHSLKSSG